MKKLIKKVSDSKTITIVLFLFFLIGILSYSFKSYIGLAIWGTKYKSPVEWNNIRIKFPNGMIYRINNESIQFFYWEEPKGFLYVRKINLTNISKEYLLDFFQEKKFQILKDEEIIFKGYKSFVISYIDNISKTYNEGIYVIPKNLCILYEGGKTNYKDFKEMVDNIEFL